MWTPVTMGSRTLVVVVGEVGPRTAAPLRDEPEAAVDKGARCVRGDFARVGFCDCSGLNVLLTAVTAAGGAGAAVRGPARPLA